MVKTIDKNIKKGFNNFVKGVKSGYKMFTDAENEAFKSVKSKNRKK